MKRTMLWVLTILLCGSLLTACGEEDTHETAPATETVAAATESISIETTEAPQETMPEKPVSPDLGDDSLSEAEATEEFGQKASPQFSYGETQKKDSAINSEETMDAGDFNLTGAF